MMKTQHLLPILLQNLELNLQSMSGFGGKIWNGLSSTASLARGIQSQTVKHL